MQEPFFYFHNYTPVVRDKPKSPSHTKTTDSSSLDEIPSFKSDRSPPRSPPKSPTRFSTSSAAVGTPCQTQRPSLKSRNMVFDITKKPISRPPSAKSNTQLFSIPRPSSAAHKGLLSTPVCRRTSPPSNQVNIPSPSRPVSRPESSFNLNISLPSNDFFSGPTLCPSPRPESTSSVGLYAKFTSPKLPQPHPEPQPRPPKPTSLTKPTATCHDVINDVASDDSDDDEFEERLAATRMKMLKEQELMMSKSADQGKQEREVEQEQECGGVQEEYEEKEEEAKVEEVKEQSEVVTEETKAVVIHQDSEIEDSQEKEEKQPQVIKQLFVSNEEKDLITADSGKLDNVDPTINDCETDSPFKDNKSEEFNINNDSTNEKPHPPSRTQSPVLSDNEVPSVCTTPTLESSCLLSYVLSPGRGSRCPPPVFNKQSKSKSAEPEEQSDWVKSVLSRVDLSQSRPQSREERVKLNNKPSLSPPSSPVSKLLQSRHLVRNLPRQDDQPSVYY
ncbi:hypothetical protein P9112_001951 [Eukaryota sp. TZLM1-RC]